MHKKYLLLLLVLFAPCNFVFAASSLSITEIMYDFSGSDDKHEWIEIENTGAEDLDITGFKIVDGGSATKHGINIPPKNGGVGSTIIPPNGYLILADDALTFFSDNTGFSGSVLDSTFSLNNTGATIQILDKDGNVSDSFAYSKDQGAAGDGNTLQIKADNTWTAALPTPGVITALEVIEPPADPVVDPPPADPPVDPVVIDPPADPPADPVDVDPPADPVSPADHVVDPPPVAENSGAPATGGGGSSTSPKAPKPVAVKAASKPKKIALSISAPAIVTVKVPLDISADFSNIENQNRPGRYVWNFGNGEIIEAKDSNQENYTYNFPGAYTIVLNYYDGSDPAPLKAKIKIKVEDNQIIIGSLDGGNIELKNKSTHQVDVSGWMIGSAGQKFILPAETLLAAGASIVLAAQITKINSIDNAALLYPSGEQAFVYEKIVTVAKLETKNVAPIKEQKPAVAASVAGKTPSLASDGVEEAKEPEVKGEQVQASAAAGLKGIQAGALFPWFAGLGGIIVLSSALAIYLLPKKMPVKLTDFTLVE